MMVILFIYLFYNYVTLILFFSLFIKRDLSSKSRLKLIPLIFNNSIKIANKIEYISWVKNDISEKGKQKKMEENLFKIPFFQDY